MFYICSSSGKNEYGKYRYIREFGEKPTGSVDPIEKLVRTFALDRKDPMSTEGQHAISEAIRYLGFCDDTMAILELFLQRAKNPESGNYKDIRSHFSAGGGPADG